MISTSLALTCPFCTILLSDNARFCQSCGKDLHATSHAGELAPIWRRVAAFLIDFLVVLLMMWGGAIGHARSRVEDGETTAMVTFVVWALVAPSVYFIGGNALGNTLGKFVLGLRTIRLIDGRVPGIRRGLGLWLASLLSILALGLGYLWAIWDPKKQTWHDKLAGTIVVRR
jgi:uncharacterized RDD family membrane protein YckC